MTQEDKQLLIKDLCARLPYETAVECSIDSGESMDVVLQPSHIDEFRDELITIKPYLRPMLSMTEEEIIEFNNIPSTKNYQIVNGDLPWDVANYKQIGWLLKNHFDFMGLIPKDLAIEVTEENNPYKE